MSCPSISSLIGREVIVAILGPTKNSYTFSMGGELQYVATDNRYGIGYCLPNYAFFNETEIDRISELEGIPVIFVGHPQVNLRELMNANLRN